jgi:hypothetical protein
MNINNKHRYKSQATIVQAISLIPGCVYTGDSGNSDWHTGLLLRHDKDYAIIADARGKEHVVILSTLRSSQVTE